jgi:hypothetical protein
MDELDRAVELFARGDVKAARETLFAWVSQHADAPTRDEALAALIPRVDHDDSRVAAYLALAGGALVESGAPAREIGRAIVAPVVRACEAARRFATRVGELPDEPGEDAIEVGDRSISRATLDAIGASDREAVIAWLSLENWYRPAVACWTRDVGVLLEVQRDRELRDAVAALGSTTATSHWLSLLLETVLDARFVVLFPELREAWCFIADGVNDIGQLSVLLSDALADPLARIGASGVAEPEALAVMRGDGPQEARAGYSSTFHLYPREALGDDDLPHDNVHMWRAPGGTGSHSLPGDFLPGTLDVVNGARLLVAVGPKAPGSRFTRIISATRTFSGLVASVGEVRLLAGEYEAWLARARS